MRAIIGKWNARRKKMPAAIKNVDEELGVTRTQSRHESLYSNRVSFLKRAQRGLGLGKRVSISQNELQRFGSRQASQTGQALARASSRPQ